MLLVEAGPKDIISGSKLTQRKIHMPAALTYNPCDDKYVDFSDMCVSVRMKYLTVHMLSICMMSFDYTSCMYLLQFKVN